MTILAPKVVHLAEDRFGVAPDADHGANGAIVAHRQVLAEQRRWCQRRSRLQLAHAPRRGSTGTIAPPSAVVKSAVIEARVPPRLSVLACHNGTVGQPNPRCGRGCRCVTQRGEGRSKGLTPSRRGRPGQVFTQEIEVDEAPDRASVATRGSRSSAAFEKCADTRIVCAVVVTPTHGEEEPEYDQQHDRPWGSRQGTKHRSRARNDHGASVRPSVRGGYSPKVHPVHRRPTSRSAFRTSIAPSSWSVAASIAPPRRTTSSGVRPAIVQPPSTTIV